MRPDPTNLILLGLVVVVLLREVIWEMQRRRGVEWRIQILELLAAAARRGYALVPVLERAAVSGPRRLADLCREMARKLGEGGALSDAMSDVAPQCFPASCTAAVRGAEGSRALADVLEDLASRTEERQSIGYRMRVALTYPVILGICLLGALAAAGPAYRALERQSWSRGPDSGIADWIGLGVLVIGVLVLQRMIHRRQSLGRLLRDLWSRRISVSKTGRVRAAGEFLGALSHVVAAGVPLPAAIRRVAGACESRELSEGVCHAASALEEGTSPEIAWSRTWLPEFAAIPVAAVARSSHRTHAETLQRTALECRYRWLRAMERSLTLVPILCVAALGVVLAFEFAALFQVELNLVQRMKPW